MRASWDDWDCVSFDLFETLVHARPGWEQRILDHSFRCLVQWLGSPTGDAARMPRCWGAASERVATEAIRMGQDPTLPRAQTWEAFARLWTGAPFPPGIIPALLEEELRCLERETVVHREGWDLFWRALAEKKRIIVTSDMHYPSWLLTRLLSFHGYEGMACVRVSSEAGFSKFRGGLFRVLLNQEGLPPARILHVGDNRWADVVSARAAGIQAVHLDGWVEGLDLHRRVGAGRVGRILAHFAHLLLLEARHGGKSRLAYVSRDGFLLALVTRRLMRRCPWLPQVHTSYVMFSRRSVSLPSRRSLGPEVIEELTRVRSGVPLLRRFLAQCDLEGTEVERPDDEGEEGILSLLADDSFQARVAAQREVCARMLARYLKQEGLWGDRDVALVDIGWQGTIQKALNRAFEGTEGWAPLEGFYLGRWSQEPASAGMVGILGDSGRRRSMRESGPWQAALVFESLCGAPHPTVVGYDETGDRVRPRMASEGDSVPGEAERRARRRLWAGVLAAVDRYAASLSPGEADVPGLRRRAQKECLRLAFHPSADELACFGPMRHREGDSKGWSVPLVVPLPSRLSVAAWKRGIASAWKGGFFAQAGGWPLACLYRGLEAGLLRLPGLRFWIQRRVSGG